MEKIKAKIVADSINQQGDRITTYLLTFPRFILAELNTHRVFSKNSASSRAIPFHKMVEMVETAPFIPIAWQKPHKGMQGTEYYDHTLTEEVGELDYKNLPRRWLRARDTAVSMAKIMTDERGNMPVTKQLANRLLEPFMWHTVLLTGTEFENFFELRCPQYELKSGTVINNNLKDKYFKSYTDLLQFIRNNSNNQLTIQEWENKSLIERLQINKSQAEIHMQALAEAMWDAMNESTPKELKEGEWHIPFSDNIQESGLYGTVWTKLISPEKKDLEFCKVKIATARCARLSYMTFDGKIDYEKDIKLHDTLLESHHMSPFEHCARAMSEEEYFLFRKGKGEADYSLGISSSNPVVTHGKKDYGWCNNFKGFIQYRYLVENDYD